MSEFSSSFHIRTNHPSKTERSLRKAGMSGVVFGPANGWLTFVPYPHSHGLSDIHDYIGTARAIALATGETVLQFAYAEDHAWSFALVGANQSTDTFACAWDQEPPGVLDQFDRSALDGIAVASRVEPYLVASRAAGDGTPHACAFAETLGLPAYRWLSPHYIEKDTEHYINAGARKIGRKPAEPPTTRLPPPRKLDLPKPDLTACEALAELRPLMIWCRPPWTLRMVSGTSRQGWNFRYYNPELRETVQGYLFPNGNGGFQSLGRGIADALVPTALPDQWLDSDEVLAIAQTVEPPEELGNTTLHRHLSLHHWGLDPPARWHVSDMNPANHFSWTIELDAQTGELLREVLSRPGEGRESWIIRPWLERIAGGPWKNI